MKDCIIITAGGTGTRFRSDLPKQFVLLKGKPILMNTVQRFYDVNNEFKFILTLPSEHTELWKQKCDEFNFDIAHQIVKGGSTRFHSVKNAVQCIKDARLVGIHDGVRPLVSSKTIKTLFETALEKGNAVASQDIFFSIRNIINTASFSVNRDEYKEIQTPQVFQYSILKEAYSVDFASEFTDDAAVVEKTGVKINLVSGNRENIKITTEQDLRIAEALWNTVF